MFNFLTQEQINTAYSIAAETHAKHMKTVKGFHIQSEDMFTTHFARAIEKTVLDKIAKELESQRAMEIMSMILDVTVPKQFVSI